MTRFWCAAMPVHTSGNVCMNMQHDIITIISLHDQAEYDAFLNGLLPGISSATTADIPSRYFYVRYRLFQRGPNVISSPISTEKSKCLLASVLARYSQFQSLLAASGPIFETLLTNSMTFALSESASQIFSLWALFARHAYSLTP